MHVVHLPLSLSTLGFETGSLTGCGVHQSVWEVGPRDVRVSSGQRLQMLSTMPSLTWVLRTQTQLSKLAP